MPKRVIKKMKQVKAGEWVQPRMRVVQGMEARRDELRKRFQYSCDAAADELNMLAKNIRNGLEETP